MLPLVAHRRLGELEHARPEPPGGAQLGDGRELLVGGGVAELHQASGVVDGHAGLAEGAQVRRTGGHGPGELLDVGRAAVVDGSRVDDEGADAALARPVRDLGSRVGGREAEVGAGVQLAALGVRQEAVDVAAVEDDGSEVEQHAVEEGRPVLPAAHPETGDAALEVDARLLVGELRVGAVDVRPDVPVALPGRTTGGLQAVEEPGRTQRGDGDAVEGGPGQLLPDQVVAVVLGEPARLAQHGRGLPLPVRDRPPVVGTREVERALLGLELTGLVQAALDGPLIGHGANLRRGARRQPPSVTFFNRAAGGDRRQPGAAGP